MKNKLLFYHLHITCPWQYSFPKLFFLMAVRARIVRRFSSVFSFRQPEHGLFTNLGMYDRMNVGCVLNHYLTKDSFDSFSYRFATDLLVTAHCQQRGNCMSSNQDMQETVHSDGGGVFGCGCKFDACSHG